MKYFKKIDFLLLTMTIVLLLIICAEQLYKNNENLNKLGFINNETANVKVDNKEEFENLLLYSNKNKLNIVKKEYFKDDIVYFYHYNFSPYEHSNNYFEKDIFGSNTGNIIKKNVIFGNILNKNIIENNDSDLLGVYKVTSEKLNTSQLEEKMGKDGFNVSQEELLGYDTPIQKYLIVVAIIVIVIVIIQTIITVIQKTKDIAVFKMYSSTRKLYIYLFGDKILQLILSSLVIYWISIFFLNIYSTHILLIYILVPTIIYIVVSLVILFRISKISNKDYMKGKMDLQTVMTFYQIAIVIIFVFLSFIAYYIFGVPSTNYDEKFKKSEWSFSRDYARVISNKDYFDEEEVFNSRFPKFNKMNAIYLDNSNFANIEVKDNSEAYNYSKKIIENMPYIDVNNNYIEYFNYDFDLINIESDKESNIVLYIPEKRKNDIKKIKNHLCKMNNTKLENMKINNCYIKTYSSRDIFVNSLISNDDGSFDSPIIRVLNSKVIADSNTALSMDTYFKINSDDSSSKNIETLTNSINDSTFFSQDSGIYSDIINEKYQNQEIKIYIDTSKIVVGSCMIILFFMLCLFIFNIIRVYLSINAKLILIMKLTGYTLIQRYKKLFIFILVSQILSNVIVILYIYFNGIGKISMMYVMYNISMYIFSSIILYYCINRLESKKISSILKGERY